jgi:hypothetical protein
MKNIRCAVMFLVLVAGGLPGGTAGDDGRFVVQSVDMTREGKKLKPPSPETPTYYLPLFEGYKELGGASREFERKPLDRDAAQQLIKMLAQQGYVMASGNFRPSMVLVFEWGSIVPVEVDSASLRRNQPPLPGHVTNAAQIRAYVVGERGRDLDRHSAFYGEMTSLEARHFLLISAFQYREEQGGDEVLLWRAHVTTGLWGNFLSDVLPLMIAHAAPIVGRNVPPGGAWTPWNGQVKVGTPVVVPDDKPPEAAPRQ